MAHRRGHCQAVARTKYEPNVSCGSDGRAHSLLETALSSHDAPSSREGRRLESPAFQRGYPLRAIPGAFDLRACRLGDIRHEQPTLTNAQIPPAVVPRPLPAGPSHTTVLSAPSRLRPSVVRLLPHSGRNLLVPPLLTLRAVAFIPQVQRPSLYNAVHFVQGASALRTQRQPMNRRKGNADRIQTRRVHIHTL